MNVFGQKKKEIEKLKLEVQELKQEVSNNHSVNHFKGVHLMDHPFIPEYLSPKVVSQKMEMTQPDSGTAEITVYSLDGWSFARPIMISEPRWTILDPNGVKTQCLISNMHSAITILESLGMNISVSDYVKKK